MLNNVLLIDGMPWAIGDRVKHSEYGTGVITSIRVDAPDDDRQFRVDFGPPCAYYGPKAEYPRRITRAEPTKTETPMTYPEKGENFGRTVSVPMGVLLSALSLCLDELEPDQTNIDLPVNIIQNILDRLDKVNNQPRAADYYLRTLRSLLNGDDNPTT